MPPIWVLLVYYATKFFWLFYCTVIVNRCNNSKGLHQSNDETMPTSEQPLAGPGDSCTCNAVVQLRDTWLELLAGLLPRDCRRCCRRTGSSDVSSDVTASSVRSPLKHDNASSATELHQSTLNHSFNLHHKIIIHRFIMRTNPAKKQNQRLG